MTTQDLENFRKQVRTDYWDKYRDTDSQDKDRWQCYIEKILPEELRLAREHLLPGDATRLPKAAREVLVLLVGFQIEPLLQAICAWKPKTIVLVLNQYYGAESGQEWGNFVAGKIQAVVSKPGQFEQRPLVGQLLLSDKAQALPLAQPANVFRCLRTERISWDVEEANQQTIAELAQQHTREQLIFDITGGKKSMVAGAYLFCAYTGIDVSYVDFDDKEYEPKYGKPYGHACQIGAMENPYQLFGLRDWQRVEELYHNNAFKAAREEVERLLPEMKGGFFTEREIKAAEKLLNALRVYELWDRGDHYEANEQLKPLNWFQTPPKVIGELCRETPQWPNVASSSTTGTSEEDAAINILNQIAILAVGPGEDLADSFYQQARLLHYAEDELARAERLRKRGDYRTSYLRAYGVYEVLIKARLVRQLVNGEFGRTQPLPPNPFPSLQDVEKRKIAKIVRRFSTLRTMREVLSDQTHSLSRDGITLQAIQGGNPSSRRLVNFWDDAATPKPSPLAEHPLNERVMTDMRNQIAHICLWVPEDLAEACIKCARANLDDFKTNWLTDTTDPKDYEPLGWEELCRQCGLKFLPSIRQ